MGANKCAIDIWYDNTIYLGGATGPPDNINWNNWLKEIHGIGVSFTGTTYPWYYVQIYSCPDSVPEPSVHSTRTYVCDNGDWDSKSNYDIDEYCPWDTSGEGLCWCADESDDFYVDEAGAVHCRDSPRDSWCSAYIAHSYKQCVAGDVGVGLYWYDNRNIRNDLIESCSSDEKCTLDGCVKEGVTIGCKLYLFERACELDNNCMWEEVGLFNKCVAKTDGNGVNGNGIGDGELRKELNISEVIDTPIITLIDSLCTGDIQCEPKSKCSLINSLISKGYMKQVQSDNLREEACDFKSGDLLNDIGGNYRNACGLLEKDKQDYFENSFGICVFGEEETGIIKILRDIGRKIPITGDPLTDGIIIAGAGLFLLVIIVGRLGIYGKVEYEIKI